MNNQSEDRVLGTVGIYLRGEYDSSVKYEYMNQVTYQGSSYTCIKEEGCTEIDPTNEDYWICSAEKGNKGDKGDTGDIGPIGPKPINGIDYNTNAEREEFKNAVVADSKADLEKYITEKETHLDNYTKEKETKLDDYVTDTVKPTIDTYVTDTTKKGIDAYEKEKEKVLDTYTDTKKTEIDNYVTNTSKPALDQYEKDKEAELETAKNTAISEYDAHAESVLTETKDLFNALDTEKISGTELYIEDAKPCRIINTEISGMYKQETTKGTNIMNLNVAQSSKVTVNEDGTITINGTGGFGLSFESFTFKANIPYYIKWEIVSGNIPTDLSLVFLSSINSKWLTKDIFNTITPTEDKESSSLWIHQNAKFENAKIRIWISESKSDFEPYTGKIPSPNLDYPQAIEQVDSVKLINKNKNLCDGINQNYYLNNDLNICGKVTGNSGLAIDVQDKSYVTVSTKITQARYRIACINSLLQEEKETTIAYRGVQKDNTSATVTINTTGYKYLIINATDLGSILAEDGSVATEYEPYKKQTVAINLKGNKLCAVSDTIKDKLLIDKNGNVALQKNVITFLLNGTNPHEAKYWRADTIYDLGNGYSHFYLYSNYPGVYQNKSTEKFTYVIADKLVTGKNILNTECINNSAQLHIQILTSRLETNDAEGFKKWLANNNITVYAKSSAPELIDLGRLPELPKTFEGINNIWAETNLGNTEIEIEYVQDVKKLLEKQAEQQNARLDNIEALLSTTETSALLLDNMQTDLEKEVE